jgi:hypothetical protein
MARIQVINPFGLRLKAKPEGITNSGRQGVLGIKSGFLCLVH